MFNYRKTVPNGNYSITLPVVRSIFDQLVLRFNLPEDTHVTLHDDINDYQNKIWTTGDHDEDANDAPRDNMINGTYRESFTDMIMTANHRNNDTKPVLEDKNSGTYVQPFKVQCKLDMAFVIESKSETLMDDITNYLRKISMEDRITTYHSIQYSYYLPKFIKEVLTEIYEARNYQLDKDDDILTWLETLSDGRATTITNVGRTLNSLDIGFKEIQNRVIGLFEEAIHDVKHEYDKDRGMYVMELTYTIYYDKVTDLDIWYPAIAYNIPLSEEITTRFENNANLLDGNADEDIANLMTFAPMSEAYEISRYLENGTSYIRIPEFDVHTDMIKVHPTTVTFNFPSASASLVPVNGFNLGGSTVINPRNLVNLSSRDNDIIANRTPAPEPISDAPIIVGTDSITQARVLGEDVRVPIFSVAPTITKEDKRNLFNLGDLGELEINEIILNIIRDSELEFITESLESPFSLELYENGSRVLSNPLMVDSDLNITSTIDLDITKGYRVLFSILPNMDILSHQTILRLEDNEDFKEYFGNVVDGINSRIPIITNIEDVPEEVINNINHYQPLLTRLANRMYRANYISHVIAKRKEQ